MVAPPQGTVFRKRVMSLSSISADKHANTRLDEEGIKLLYLGVDMPVNQSICSGGSRLDLLHKRCNFSH
jgi:hypothetical protein